MALLLIVLGAAALYCASVALRIQVQEITLPVRYTGFGEAHFYKDRWYYLLQFVTFGVIVGITHALLMVKLYSIERHQAARIIGWMTILLLIIAAAYAHSVLSIAFIH